MVAVRSNLKGKIKGEYILTASADTREQPLNQMFSNFSSKDPALPATQHQPELLLSGLRRRQHHGGRCAYAGKVLRQAAERRFARDVG